LLVVVTWNLLDARQEFDLYLRDVIEHHGPAPETIMSPQSKDRKSQNLLSLLVQAGAQEGGDTRLKLATTELLGNAFIFLLAGDCHE
jgi:cytochrome P450